MRNINFISIMLRNHLVSYPTPANLNYFWSFGSSVGMFLVIQIVSGFFLSMHYSSEAVVSFASIEYTMRVVNQGWLLRYIHANGASFFLLLVYAHIWRSLYYRSYSHPREAVWYSGIVLLLLIIITAFFGYVLPWGQMSFWAATVITNLVSAIPYVGLDVLYWFWGGYAVNEVTLSRFFSLHFLLPFIISALAVVHIAILHQVGSSNPLATENIADYVTFYPYFYLKDLFFFLCVCFVFSFFVFLNPNLLSHPDNNIKANPLVTPASIVPEWYFLPFYAILRAVPTKIGGIFCLVSSICVLVLLPILDSNVYAVRNPKINVCYSVMFMIWVLSFILLGWLGAAPMEYPFVQLSRIFMYYHFFFFLIYIPIIDPIVTSLFNYNKIEKCFADNIEVH